MTAAGIVWSVITLLAWGGASIFDKLALNSMKGLSSLAAVIIRMMFAVLGVFIIALCTGNVDEVSDIKPITVLYLALSGVFGAVIGQGAYYYAAKSGQVSKIVAFTAGYPLVTVVLAIAFLHEPLTWRKIAATAMIVGGLIILALSREAPEKQEPAAAVEPGGPPCAGG